MIVDLHVKFDVDYIDGLVQDCSISCGDTAVLP